MTYEYIKHFTVRNIILIIEFDNILPEQKSCILDYIGSILLIN